MLNKARLHLQEVDKIQKIMAESGQKAEVKRIESIRTPLTALIDKLKPNEDEADYFRSVKAEDEDLSVSLGIYLIIYNQFLIIPEGNTRW